MTLPCRARGVDHHEMVSVLSGDSKHLRVRINKAENITFTFMIRKTFSAL